MEAIHMNNSSFIHHGGGRFTNDLLIEILVRLPFKSLARFKCVSKAWKTLLSDPRFQKRLPTTMIGLFYQQWRITPGEVGFVPVSDENSRRTESLTDFDLTFCPIYPNLRFMGCANGLLLFLHGSARPPCPYVYHGSLPPHPDVFYVCNPVTRRWVVLPECPRTNIWYDSVLVFDPRISPHFKVIRIDSQQRSSSLELTVFCSETGSWVKSTITSSLLRRRLISRGIVSSSGETIYRMTYPQTVLRINVEDRTCTEIKLPGKAAPFPRFGLFGGNLYCAQILEGSELQVWELKKNSDGNSEWVLKQSKCIKAALLRQNIEWSSESAAVILLAFHLEVEDVVYFGVSNKIVSYNVDIDVAEVIFSFSQPFFQVSNDLRVHPFRPSLLDSPLRDANTTTTEHQADHKGLCIYSFPCTS